MKDVKIINHESVRTRIISMYIVCTTSYVRNIGESEVTQG